MTLFVEKFEYATSYGVVGSLTFVAVTPDIESRLGDHYWR